MIPGFGQYSHSSNVSENARSFCAAPTFSMTGNFDAATAPTKASVIWWFSRGTRLAPGCSDRDSEAAAIRSRAMGSGMAAKNRRSRAPVEPIMRTPSSLQQTGHGRSHRLAAHRLPVARKALKVSGHMYPGSALDRPGQPHGAHRFARHCAVGTRNSRDRHRHLRARTAQSAESHRTRHGLADGALGVQHRHRHTETADLRLVAVGDEPLDEPL